MPLDLGQFLRNSISVDRYEAMRSGNLESAEKAVASQETGTLMGTAFVVENDPLAELMDSMEELSFQFEEKESKDVNERKLGENRGKDNPYIRAMENWLKTLPDMPGSEFTNKLLSMLRQARSSGQMPSAQELLKELAREKLVIMVTHNPELAERYATRVIRRRDGSPCFAG